MNARELDQQLRLVLAQLELVSTAPTQAFDPGGGKDDTGDGTPAGAAKTPADHFRVRLAGVQTGLQRRLDAAEATGDEDQRADEERKAHEIAHDQREAILSDAQREWRTLTGHDGEAPRARTADLDTEEGIEEAVLDEAPGKAADDVAAKLGLTVFTVRRLYVKAGLDPHDGTLVDAHSPIAERRRRAKQMAERGMSERQIGKLLGVGKRTVRKDLGRAA